MLNDAFVQDFTVTTDEAHPQVYETRIGVPAGQAAFSARVVRRKRGGKRKRDLHAQRPPRPAAARHRVREVAGTRGSAPRRDPGGSAGDRLEAAGQTTLTPAGEYVLAHDGEVSITIDIKTAPWVVAGFPHRRQRRWGHRRPPPTRLQPAGANGPASIGDGAEVILRAPGLRAAGGRRAGAHGVPDRRETGEGFRRALRRASCSRLPKQRVFLPLAPARGRAIRLRLSPEAAAGRAIASRRRSSTTLPSRKARTPTCASAESSCRTWKSPISPRR